MLFEDRRDAGSQLASALCEYAGPSTVVLGLTRGGVVVAAEVARALGVPLEAIITRKIGAPGNPEYAIGAIAEGGEPVLNEAEIHLLGISEAYLHHAISEQKREIAQLQAVYRGGHPLTGLSGKTVVLVDDGIATGYTMRAAVEAVRRLGAARIVVAVPVGPRETIQAFRRVVDAVVCLASPEPFFAVGAFYEDFSQVTDEMVKRCLAEAAERMAAGTPGLCRPRTGASAQQPTG